MAQISRGFVANLIGAHTLDAFGDAARRNKPDIAILGAEHSPSEKDIAERLVRELNPKVQIVRM